MGLHNEALIQLDSEGGFAMTALCNLKMPAKAQQPVILISPVASSHLLTFVSSIYSVF